jgi:hypothetical protein
VLVGQAHLHARGRVDHGTSSAPCRAAPTPRCRGAPPPPSPAATESCVALLASSVEAPGDRQAPPGILPELLEDLPVHAGALGPRVARRGRAAAPTRPATRGRRVRLQPRPPAVDPHRPARHQRSTRRRPPVRGRDPHQLPHRPARHHRASPAARRQRGNLARPDPCPHRRTRWHHHNRHSHRPPRPRAGRTRRRAPQPPARPEYRNSPGRSSAPSSGISARTR